MVIECALLPDPHFLLESDNTQALAERVFDQPTTDTRYGSVEQPGDYDLTPTDLADVHHRFMLTVLSDGSALLVRSDYDEPPLSVIPRTGNKLSSLSNKQLGPGLAISPLNAGNQITPLVGVWGDSHCLFGAVRWLDIIHQAS